MHIIALEDDPSSLRGGQELNLLEVCRGLSQHGHSITLIYAKEGNLLQEYQELCTRVVKVDGYEIDRSTIKHIFKLLSDIWKIPRSKNSVIFSNQYSAVFFGSILSVSRNTPFVCYLQLPPIYPSSRSHAIGIKAVKKFITVSNQTKLDWVKRGFKEEKIDVVYNGTNTEVFKPANNFSAIRSEWNIPEDSRIISYVGRLDKEKGLETLIKALALLLESGKIARLLIAGKPVTQGEGYKKSLEQLVNDLGIDKYVDFLGHVANTTSVYQVSDVTVLPSWWSEPFGRTIIESMACGTPVVASRTGGIPEILTGEFQSGLFEPKNERDLADTLNVIMNWRDKNPQLGERCREHVLSKFTLDKMVNGVEKVLLRLVKR